MIQNRILELEESILQETTMLVHELNTDMIMTESVSDIISTIRANLAAFIDNLRNYLLIVFDKLTGINNEDRLVNFKGSKVKLSSILELLDAEDIDNIIDHEYVIDIINDINLGNPYLENLDMSGFPSIVKGFNEIIELVKLNSPLHEVKGKLDRLEDSFATLFTNGISHKQVKSTILNSERHLNASNLDDAIRGLVNFNKMTASKWTKKAMQEDRQTVLQEMLKMKNYVGKLPVKTNNANGENTIKYQGVVLNTKDHGYRNMSESIQEVSSSITSICMTTVQMLDAKIRVYKGVKRDTIAVAAYIYSGKFKIKVGGNNE